MRYSKDMSSAEREAYNAYMRSYMLERYHRRRTSAIQQLGGRCVDCGSKEDLELDHSDRTTKTYDISKILSTGSEKKVQEELLKCVVRCEPCHQKKTIQEMGWLQHGSYRMYRRHGCRCETCVRESRRRGRESYARRVDRRLKRESAGAGS